jgi:formylglycine-generating enzyme required for sulfatase activity
MPAGDRGWGEEITKSIGMKLVRILAGKFMMGSPAGEADRDTGEVQHEVENTNDFYLGIHEVTQKHFKDVMGDNPSYFSAAHEGKPGEEYKPKPAAGRGGDSAGHGRGTRFVS